MDAEQYRRALAQLALSQEAAGVEFGSSPRSGQRWAAEGPPASVAILVRLLLARKISLEDVAAALRPGDRKR